MLVHIYESLWIDHSLIQSVEYASKTATLYVFTEARSYLVRIDDTKLGQDQARKIVKRTHQATSNERNQS